jgi:hypothetical protein
MQDHLGCQLRRTPGIELHARRLTPGRLTDFCPGEGRVLRHASTSAPTRAPRMGQFARPVESTNCGPEASGIPRSLNADDYLTPEARARIEIDRQLIACGWAVQDYKRINLGAGRGIAVREFVMDGGYDAADYLLFVDRNAVGVIEAKKEGATLTGVEVQSRKYIDGLPEKVSALVKPPPFAFESTGIETRLTNGFDPEPASRGVFTFYGSFEF